MKPRRRLILAAAVLAASRAEVGAQPAVTRPIRLLVPFGAGGPTVHGPWRVPTGSGKHAQPGRLHGPKVS